MTTKDNVNNPAHYTFSGIECIDAIRAALTPEEFRGFCKGNALKYTWRERHKGGDESIRKAAWYYERLLDEAKPKDDFSLIKKPLQSSFPPIDLQGPFVAPKTEYHDRKAYGLKVAESVREAAIREVTYLEDANLIRELNLPAIVDKVENAK